MSRAARIKQPTAIYHIMSRSITEFDMFPDNSDKERFLDILQECMQKYHSKIYGYCLMTNHYHLIIDTCGHDISKVMKSLNQRYVNYIKKIYKRRGSLLAERFNSKIVDTDEYLLTVSAYLHNNPKDLPGYNGKEYEYPYSSMGIYLGKIVDRRGLVDTDFILGCINPSDRSKAVKAYKEMVIEKRDTGVNNKLKKYLQEFENEQNEYKSYRDVIFRDKKPEDIIKLLANKYKITDISQRMHRWKRKTMEFRQVIAYTLTVFCGMNVREVCKYMHNISGSCCVKLCNKGFEAFSKNIEIKSIILGI